MSEAITGRKASWRQDPEAVRADILRVATTEFAERGLAGARIDDIARKTRTSKRMIYYYFEDKEGLYLRVLEGAYSKVRAVEDALDIDGLDPVSALRVLAEQTFDAHCQNPDFIRLVMIENIHRAGYVKQSKRIPRLNLTIIDKLDAVCRRGKAEGLFYDDADPLHLHWVMSAFSFYNVSNRATFSYSFGGSLFSRKGQAELRRRLVDMALAATVRGYVHEETC